MDFLNENPPQPPTYQQLIDELAIMFFVINNIPTEQKLMQKHITLLLDALSTYPLQ